MPQSTKLHVEHDHSSLKGIVSLSWRTPGMLKALKSVLEQVGMDVRGPVATTAEAKRLIAEDMPQLAVVDVNLKREMACGLIDELHDQGDSVVVISGYAAPPVSADKAVTIRSVDQNCWPFWCVE